MFQTLRRGDRGLTIQQLVRDLQSSQDTTDEILGEPSKSKSKDGILDRRFVRRLQKIERLSKRDQQALLRNLDNFIKGAGVD